MAYAKEHVAAGVLTIDADGRIWRTAKRLRNGDWQSIAPKRAENVGGKGYLRISIGVPGQRSLAIVMAHNLVYECKVGPIPDGLELNHEDLNKTNNRPLNLVPMTGAQNIQHSYDHGRTKPWSRTANWRGRPKLSEDQKREACEMRRAGALLKDIGERFGIGTTHAQRITGGAR
jgi:hypothetical protein